nr:protein kinase family protein, putative, expressed [Oryza sativa Japonica Group]
MEWIRSEIKKERPKNDWIAGAAITNPAADRKKPKRRAREWWREEYADELAKKQKRRALAKSKSEQAGLQWWERDIDDDLDAKGRSKWSMMKSWSRRSNGSTGNGNGNGNGSINWWVNGARSTRDWASGEFVPKSSGAVSSTPSMRGTVCYVAPEYGGGGPLSERCDIYSYGVLLLVLISGRRPLQVTASPMSEFEKSHSFASKGLQLVDHQVRRYSECCLARENLRTSHWSSHRLHLVGSLSSPERKFGEFV